MGFEPLDEDPCILIRCAEDYIVIYVDDMIIAATTDEGIDRFINELSSRFNTKILGEPSRFLGCKLVRNIDDDTITMSQSAYVPDILKESGFYDWHAGKTSVPMKSTYKVQISETTADEDTVLQYQNIARMKGSA
ncbi:hypothetical protein DTO282F9_2390 [Paecilomyces variotii]|nr:hypothetical protein DTO282F9_2390 [Paecilomyces variotii]